MKLLDCKHREMVCNALEPCDFQEFADNDVGIVFCSLTKSEQSIRQDEREKVLDKLEKLLCAHHKYVGSYRVIAGTNEEIYDEMFDAMQNLRKQEQP